MSNRRRGRLKPLDIPILIVAVAITLVTAWRVYGRLGEASTVVVEGNSTRWIYPLNADTSLAVPGPLGETFVRIYDGKAEILSSPCPNQSCVAAGPISKTGQWTACLPNAVLIRIEGSEVEAEIDAIAY